MVRPCKLPPMGPPATAAATEFDRCETSLTVVLVGNRDVSSFSRCTLQ